MYIEVHFCLLLPEVAMNYCSGRCLDARGKKRLYNYTVYIHILCIYFYSVTVLAGPDVQFFVICPELSHFIFFLVFYLKTRA